MHVAVEVASPAGPHARLAREVEDHGRTMQDPFQVPVDEVSLLEGEVLMGARPGKVLLLARAFVVVAEAVDPDYFMARRQQPLAEVRADETGGPGDHYPRWGAEHSDKSGARDRRFATATYLLCP